MYSDNHLDIFGSETGPECKLPLAQQGVSAGFPSPAEDVMDMSLDLNKELVKNPSSTFFARVRGVSMIDAGISDGDLLVIDKSLEAIDGSIAVAYIDGEFTLKRIKIEEDHLYLIPANSNYKPILITSDNDFVVWGVVRFVIKQLR